MEKLDSYEGHMLMTSKLQKPCVFWFVGINGSGKTTLGQEIAAEFGTLHLDDSEFWVPMIRGLDMDNDDHIMESEYRAAIIATYAVMNGASIVCSFPSFSEQQREIFQEMVELAGGKFIVIYTDCSADECSRRSGWHVDTDGFEEPLGSDIMLDTEHQSITLNLREIFLFLEDRNLVGSWSR